MIERKSYLDWLKKWKDKQIIKVVSGVRRCGKSTLFTMFETFLIQNGVEEIQIIHINFKDLEYEDLTNYKSLYQYIQKRLLPNQMNYIFLDEVQNVECFEKTVNSLFLKENCDIYLMDRMLTCYQEN